MANLNDVAALFGNFNVPSSLTDEEIDNILEYLNEKEDECECGSEKVYGSIASHSDWCPKYK